jgi:hypothetical protein
MAPLTELLTLEMLVYRISNKCQTALGNIVSSPDAKCLNPEGLVAIALQNANTSLIDPINTWLVGLCAQPACSNATRK